MNTLDTYFGTEGALATQLEGYAPRPQQLGMANAILETLDARGTLVAEAGTGTGKTLAYLIPAVLSGRKVIISTATRTLQDQLFRKDLPLLRRALGIPFKASLLKGRSNYLCLYRLHHHLGFNRGHEPRDALIIERIRRWSTITRTGDIGEIADVPEGSPHWHLATSTLENCLGADCPHTSDCHLLKARARAREADLVVINHHLLWADWRLRNEGQGELLPSAEGVIVDEAHQFVESATAFLGSSVRSSQIIDLARDILREKDKDAPELTGLATDCLKLEALNQQFRQTLGPERRRDAWTVVNDNQPLIDALSALAGALERLGHSLGAVGERSRGLDACGQRAASLAGQLAGFNDTPDDTRIRWFETSKAGYALNQSPLEIGSEFRTFQALRPAAWIFTSATLTHRRSFAHFTDALGLDSPRTAIWESPFDFRQNARLYIPPSLPDPSEASHTAAVLDAALPLIEANKGRTFLLFTSHQALNRAAQQLIHRTAYPLFVQGTQPKMRLLDSFKSSGQGILLGTATFWEGVDVQGPTLSLVVIDKLPFASPGDPVLSAKLESLRKKGLNPFRDHQLPSATLSLKQGVGRLIRSSTDQGVIMLCDPRILSKPYGRAILESLPPLPLTQSLEEVVAFLTVIDRQSHDHPSA